MEEKSKLKKILSLAGLGLILGGLTYASLFFGPSINYEDKAVSKTFFDKNYYELNKLNLEFVKYSKIRNLAGDKYTYTTELTKNFDKGITKKNSSQNMCSGEQQFIIDIKSKKLIFVEEEVQKYGLKQSYEAASNCLNYVLVNRNVALQNNNFR